LIDYEALCGVGADATRQYPEVTAPELAVEIASNPDLALVDVREPHEWSIGHIAGAQLIPLGELAGRVDELSDKQKIVTYCHTGVRSLHALAILKRAGYENTRSLRGGIEAWSTEVDPSVPRY
jgi:rhodanese-related sulfurtransferase